MDTPSSISVASSSSGSSVELSGQSSLLNLPPKCEPPEQLKDCHSKSNKGQSGLSTLLRKGSGLSIQRPLDTPFPKPAPARLSTLKECTDEAKIGDDSKVNRKNQRTLDEEATVMDVVVKRYQKLQTEWYQWYLCDPRPPFLSPPLSQDKCISEEDAEKVLLPGEDALIVAHSQHRRSILAASHQVRHGHHGDQAQWVGRSKFSQTKGGVIRRFGRQWGTEGRRWLSRLFGYRTKIGVMHSNEYKGDCPPSWRSPAHLASSAREGHSSEISLIAPLPTGAATDPERRSSSEGSGNSLAETRTVLNNVWGRTKEPPLFSSASLEGDRDRPRFSWLRRLARQRSVATAARTAGGRRLEAFRSSLVPRFSLRGGGFKSTLFGFQNFPGRWKVEEGVRATRNGVGEISAQASNHAQERLPSAWELPFPCASPPRVGLHARAPDEAEGDPAVRAKHPNPDHRIDIEDGRSTPGVVQTHASCERNEGYQAIQRYDLDGDLGFVRSGSPSRYLPTRAGCQEGGDAMKGREPLSLNPGTAAVEANVRTSPLGLPSSPAPLAGPRGAFYSTPSPPGPRACARDPDEGGEVGGLADAPLWTARDLAIRRVYDDTTTAVCEELVRGAVEEELGRVHDAAQRALSEWILHQTLDSLAAIEEENRPDLQGFRFRFSGVLDHIRSGLVVSLSLLELNEEDKEVLSRIKARSHEHAVAIQPPRDGKQAIVGFSPMTYAQLGTLRPGVWLNDQVINNYLGLVCWEVNQKQGAEQVASLGTHFFAKVSAELFGLKATSFLEKGGLFTDAGSDPPLPPLSPNSSIPRWLRRRSHLLLPYASHPAGELMEGADSVDPSAALTTTMHTLLIPVNLSDQHWVLVVFRKDLDTWYYYDSMWAPRAAARARRILRVLEHALAECRRYLFPDAVISPGVGSFGQGASRYVVAQPYVSAPPERSDKKNTGELSTKRRRSRLDTLHPYGSLEALKNMEIEYKRRRLRFQEGDHEIARVDGMSEALAGAPSEAEREEAIWVLSGFDLMPQQRNSDDCGVFVCASAWCAAQGLAVSFEQDVQQLRDVIALELWSMKTLRRLPTADTSSSMDVNVFNTIL